MVDRGKFIFTGIPDKGQRRNERIKLPQFCNPSWIDGSDIGSSKPLTRNYVPPHERTYHHL